MDALESTDTGVLLINLGTPDAPEIPAVRSYLREFLSDPRVIDIPTIARFFFLNLVILPFRTKRSAEAYKKIWRAEGSPLLYYSQKFLRAITHALGNNYTVELAMRYGNPSIPAALDNLLKEPIKKIIILPLFPQYSSAASGSAIAKALEMLQQTCDIPEIHVLDNFHNHPGFIHAYKTIIQEHFRQEFLLFSYHGLPERHIEKSKRYRDQCYATSHALATALGLKQNQYHVSFQSRLGRTPWIKPYTDLLLPDLAQQGIKHLAIACPSFVSDCLETLEEIGIRARAQWQNLGGQSFQLIPSLNDHPCWIDAVKDIIKGKREELRVES